MVDHKLDQELQSVNVFFAAVLSLRTVEECQAFFDDVCTNNELKALAQRFAIANLLSQGKTYQYIERETRSSPAQIARVKRCMQEGSQGMAHVLRRLHANEQRIKGEAEDDSTDAVDL